MNNNKFYILNAQNINKYNCKKCSNTFPTKKDKKYHYDLYHKKWYFAERCFKGFDCLDIECEYNHYEYIKDYIVEREDKIPMSICDYDLPWIGIRCTNEMCDKDHFLVEK